jgi:iron complex transport system substrate-binding protein
VPFAPIACLLAAVSTAAGADAPTDSVTPQRIVAIAPNTAEIICALGACDRLVGVSPFATYPPELKDIPKVGGLRDPDLESVLALRPDLVILRGHSDKLEKLCRHSGIDVLHDRTDSFDSIFQTITQLGAVLGVDNRAKELNKSLHEQLSAIAAKAPNHRPTVFLTLRSPDRLANLTTVGNRTYLNEIIEIAGGKNLFSDLDVAYPQVSLEEVLARDPDVIVEAMPGVDIDARRREQLMDQWRSAGFRAQADAGRIHFLTDDFALIPSPRVVQTARRLSDILASTADQRGQ